MSQSAVIHEEFAYAGHNAVIHAVCYNRVQDCFVSCDDANLRLWRPSANRTECELRAVALPPRTSNFIQAIEFVDSRQFYVAAALDGTLKVFDAELNELTSVFAGRSAILSLVFDGKNSRLFSGGVDGCAAWNVRGKPLLEPDSILNPQYDISAATGFFHYASTVVAKMPPALPPSAMGRGAISNAPTPGGKALGKRSDSVLEGSKKRVIKPNELSWVQSVQLNSEMTRLYAHSKHRVDVFSASDGHHIDTFADLFPQENGAMTAFVFHEKTQYLVCGCINGYIFIVSVHPTAIVHVFKDHTMAVTGLAVHLSSHLIISSSLDGTVRLWDLEARRQSHRLDIRQPVYSLGILTPRANPCRFYCRVRNAVKLYTIRSAAKEHLASLSPISVLLRVAHPTAPTVILHDSVIPGEKLSPTRRLEMLPPCPSESDDASDSVSEGPDPRQPWIVAAGTDRTIRFYTGRAANEAPSFTWIPEEHALDVSGFSLHAASNKLFILLESQKIVVVEIKKRQEGEVDGERMPRPNRVVDMNHVPSLIGGGGGTASTQPPHRLNSPLPVKPHAEPRKAPRPLLKKASTLAVEAAASTNLAKPASTTTGGGNSAANPSVRGPVRCICCCSYPPIFRSAAQSVAAVGDASSQLKWFSRTFVSRRQQSKRDIKRLGDLSSPSSSPPRASTNASSAAPAMVQSDREWIVCGSEYGHLIFWHSGLTNSFQEAISLDAHDASIVAICASASSPLLVSLDASKRVHIWQFQPVFTLRQMLELHDQPTCFVLSPFSEIVLSGYEDGRVVLMHVSDTLESVETHAGTDENHDAMISAGDFLDDKQIVLTASVDAVIKIWDHQKNLLRQIQVAMALTCLCFMNDDGDVMAGVAGGIFMLPKEDLMPEKLPDAATGSPSPPARQKNLPFWLGGTEAADAGAQVTLASPSQPKKETEEAPTMPQPLSCVAHKPIAIGKKATVSFCIAGEKDDALGAAERVEIESSHQDEPAEASGTVKWKRKSPATMSDSLKMLMGGVPTALAPLNPPVLRKNLNQQRTTPPVSRPPSLRPYFPVKDPDWRDVIMPTSALHMANQLESLRNKYGTSSVIAELKALVDANVPQCRAPSPSSTRPPTSPTSDPPPAGLVVGLADGELVPLQYCKHQAPVPPKIKTPRKLWNAIGGEDRRLIAVQRNLPSI